MNYDNLVTDFATRTLRNLQYVRDAAAQEQGAFEVTQLINSLLGLIVLPKEQLRDRLPSVPVAQLQAQGWPMALFSGDRPPGNLSDLMRLLRNGVAHFNIEFMSVDSETISGLRIWNKNNGAITWEATLSLADIDTFVAKMAEQLQVKGK